MERELCLQRFFEYNIPLHVFSLKQAVVQSSAAMRLCDMSASTGGVATSRHEMTWTANRKVARVHVRISDFFVSQPVMSIWKLWILGAHLYFHHGLRSEGALNQQYVVDVSHQGAPGTLRKFDNLL